MHDVVSVPAVRPMVSVERACNTAVRLPLFNQLLSMLPVTAVWSVVRLDTAARPTDST